MTRVARRTAKSHRPSLDLQPTPTCEQLEVLAAAVLAMHDRWLAPAGRPAADTDEKSETISRAYEIAGSLLGIEHRDGHW